MTSGCKEQAAQKTPESPIKAETAGRRATERRVSSLMPKKEGTVQGPLTFSKASRIPRLEAEDLMELRLLRHSLELGAPTVR